MGEFIMKMSEFDNMGTPFPKLEDDHEQSGYNEFDRESERQEEIQRNIDSRVDGMKQDFPTVVRIIFDNFDVIQAGFENGRDQAKWIDDTITYYMELEAERDLGL